MTIEFTTEESDLITKNRKPFLERPSFFNSQSGELQKISEDFESYLILQKQTDKQKTLQWIRRTILIEIDSADRDSLLESYLAVRKTDASTRLTELDEESQKFAEFRENLSSDGDRRFDGVVELNILTTTLQKPIDQIVIQRDSAFHEQNLITILEQKLAVEKSDDDTKRELDSWQVVLSAYEGVSGGAVE